jgi:serine/threonine protein kinase
MHLSVKILDTAQRYFIKKVIRIHTIQKINEGSYGIVYLTNFNKCVIKIIKKDIDDIFTNEISVFYKLKKFEDNYPTHLVKYMAVGKIIDCNKIKYINCHILFMNKYEDFFTFYSILNSAPLIFIKHYKTFIIKTLYKILLVNQFFEQKLNLINIDIKLSNIMIHNNDIIIIDLGMLVQNGNIYIDNHSNHSEWPYGKTLVKYVPNYSLAKIILYLLYKNKKYIIELDNDIKEILKLLLAKKYDTQYMIEYIRHNHICEM